MQTIIYLSLALIMSIFHSCSEKFSPKFFNSTNTGINISAVHINKNKVPFSPIDMPPRTPTQYPSVDIGSILLETGDILDMEVKSTESKIEAACQIPEPESGVCILTIYYNGTNSLRCGFDCYDGDPFA